MINAYIDFFRRYANFKGKSSVGEFWWVALINLIIGICLAFVGETGIKIAGVYGLITIIPGLAITVRRLHDTDRSGFNILWIFVPILGWIILLVCLARRNDNGVPRSLLR